MNVLEAMVNVPLKAATFRLTWISFHFVLLKEFIEDCPST